MYDHIKSPMIKEAQFYQDKILELQNKISTESDNSAVLGEIYEYLYPLCTIVFNQYKIYKPESYEWIVSYTCSEVIERYLKNKDFRVYYWFNYLRLTILHVRDKYMRDVEVSNREEVYEYDMDPIEIVENKDRSNFIQYKDKVIEAFNNVMDNVGVKLYTLEYYYRLISLDKDIVLQRLVLKELKCEKTKNY